MKGAIAYNLVVIYSLGFAFLAAAVPAADRSPRAPSRARRVTRVEPSWVSSPRNLEGLCGQSDTVVVAQVAGIFRESHTPLNCPTGPMCVVYELNVEQYLQSDGAPQQPPTLKVYVNGGIDETGNAQVIDGEPLLNPGDRYILFLRSSGGEDRIGMNNGFWGIESYADEYLVADRIRGKLRLDGGVTAAPDDPYQAPEPWSWEVGGGSLLGLTQDEAITQILQGIQAAAAAEAGASGFNPD